MNLQISYFAFLIYALDSFYKLHKLPAIYYRGIPAGSGLPLTSLQANFPQEIAEAALPRE